MSNRALAACIQPLLFIMLLLTACNDKPMNPAAEYGDALIGSQNKARNATVIANLDTVQKAIQEYRTINEKYPETLKDLEGILGSGVDLTNYNYDPQTGTASLK